MAWIFVIDSSFGQKLRSKDVLIGYLCKARERALIPAQPSVRHKSNLSGNKWGLRSAPMFRAEVEDK